jgi:hypothetical protein
VTDWSGHIDALVGAGIIIFIQFFINLYFLNKLRSERSIIYYGQNESKPHSYDSPFDYSGHRIDRVGTISKK